MRRREFIAIFAAMAAWPVAGSAQHSERIPRIGVLMASEENNPQYQTYVAVFRDAFQKLGWAEGL
jgi:putative ABC transport system substrate-binding protein